MKVAACRDCGALVAADARGCPHCARNLAAERRLARVFWLAVVPMLVLLLSLFIFLMHRR